LKKRKIKGSRKKQNGKKEYFSPPPQKKKCEQKLEKEVS